MTITNAKRHIFVLAIIALSLLGCTETPRTSPLQSPQSIPPTPVPPSPTSATSTPTPLPTYTPPPTWTPFPSPTPTPTYPPYTDAPFRIVFMRDGEFWQMVVGSNGETRLVSKPENWRIGFSRVSPSCDQIAYIVRREEPEENRHIMVQNLNTGAIQQLDDDTDSYFELGLRWIDDTHITFYRSEDPATGLGDATEVYYDLVTGESTVLSELMLPEQLSPDGRYRLTSTCDPPQGKCRLVYTLYDLESGEQWPVSEDRIWRFFNGWSTDSQWMLFTAGSSSGEDTPMGLSLFNVHEREELYVETEEGYIRSATWSPDGLFVAYPICDRGREECSLWVYDLDMGTVLRLAEAMDYYYAWSPDSERLLFNQVEQPTTIWSVRTDGMDIRPVLSNAYPIAVCEP